MMLSISSTYREAFLLVRSHFWRLFCFTLVIGTPKLVCDRIVTLVHHTPAERPLLFFLLLCGLVSLFFYALLVAVIIGLLHYPSSGKTPWLLLWNSLKKYTWTLVKLKILLRIPVLLALITFAPAIVLLHIKMQIVSAVCLTAVLMNYAIASLFVVVERMDALAALKRSWQMIRGYLSYVLGCSFFFWVALWTLEYIWGLSGVYPVNPSGELLYIKKLTLIFADSIWIVLSWCMYVRVKAAEAQTTPAEAVPAS